MEGKFLLLKTACTRETGCRGPWTRNDMNVSQESIQRREAIHRLPQLCHLGITTVTHMVWCPKSAISAHIHLLKAEYIHSSQDQRTNAINNKQKVWTYIILKIIYRTGKILSIISHDANENYSHNSICHSIYIRIKLRICQLLTRMWRLKHTEVVEV